VFFSMIGHSTTDDNSLGLPVIQFSSCLVELEK
jgi:hypothetical protein